MNLQETVFTVCRSMSGQDSFTVNIGDNLVIKNGDTEIFKDKPTGGKKWRVVITLNISESNS